MKNKVPVCPKCGKPATPVNTKWGVKHEHCGLWSWEGRPLVDRLTHDLRQGAHAVFDRMWQSRQMTRGDAYKWMREALDLPPEKCHISQMDEDTARKLIDKVRERS